MSKIDLQCCVSILRWLVWMNFLHIRWDDADIMKFRQFEFKLFPKLRNRKKKKSKVCHSDFPRDIGRDKKFNYSKSSCYEYYDNPAADDGFSELISDEKDILDGLFRVNVNDARPASDG